MLTILGDATSCQADSLRSGIAVGARKSSVGGTGAVSAYWRISLGAGNSRQCIAGAGLATCLPLKQYGSELHTKRRLASQF